MLVHTHAGISGDESTGADFTLGDWIVQPTLNRLSRHGTSVPLRPQLIDVLVCLARGAGQTVTRAELLDRVWPNQFIADTALARCVAELRQALGDSAQAPTFIETIPKRGYRLIAPIAPADGRGHERAPALLPELSRPHPFFWQIGWRRRLAITPGTVITLSQKVG